MTGGSVQLRRFRIAIRDGETPERAAEIAGIAIAEARLILKDDEANPPPAEAFVMIGHNSGETEPMTTNVTADQLRLFIERIERLEEEKRGIGDDIKDVYSEAKANGYDPKIMREVIRLRRMEAQVRQEREAVLEVYMNALGMLADTPLGQAALRQVA